MFVINMGGFFPYHIETVLLWLPYTLLMFSPAFCTFNVHCNQKDMNTLLRFREGVTDPANLLSSWLTQKDCCQWKGVGCDNFTGRVTELSLPCHVTIPSAYAYQVDDKSHCLTGVFELSLLDLEYLTHLNLSNNHFTTIQYNQLGSQKCNVSSTGIGSLWCNNNSSNLHYLDLSYNHDLIIDNIDWLSYLSSLQYLDLSGIYLNQTIDWLLSIAVVPSLSELHLRSCKVRNLCHSLQYALTSIEVLDISENYFSSDGLTSCNITLIDHSQNDKPSHPKIKTLRLSGSYITGPIPDWFGQLEHLQELDLSHNKLSGQIPPILGNLSSLIVLHLESNQLSGSLPESLWQLINLEVLAVGDNPLTGLVSERNFVHLSKLKHLFLSSPTLTYNFDPTWIPPFELEGIQLGYMGIPSWLFTQSSLKRLTITDSIVSFEPHDTFWNFAVLDYLCLENNQLHADVSSVLLNATVTLLSSNYLRGGLPKISSKVVVLDLHNNYFSGSISPLLCHKMEEESNLQYLDISSNFLSGELTNCWMQWKSLAYIHLGNNKLTGKIPHSMGFLSNLISLSLHNNEFSGELPLSLKSCRNLLVLDLGENEFIGPLPSWIGWGVKALILRSNRFSGNIPQQICQLNSLIMLDFSNNRLTGPIPNCLHNMTTMVSNEAVPRTLELDMPWPWRGSFPIGIVSKGYVIETNRLFNFLDLSSNNLSGTVPSEVFKLTGLISLNLSHNQLVGTIPPEVGNMKEMESLDLSYNRLSGKITQSMDSLNFLMVLNVSFNNMTGPIPQGIQLSSFSNDSYMGNPELCGPPLTKRCLPDEKPHNAKQRGEHNDSEESKANSWFFNRGSGIGFSIRFSTVLAVMQLYLFQIY